MGSASAPAPLTAMPSASVCPPHTRHLALDRGLHRRIERAFHAENLNIRLHLLHRHGAARDQPAAADGEHRAFEVRLVLQQFRADSALPCDDTGVVIRMDEDKAALLAQLPGDLARLGHRFPGQDHLGAESFGVADLYEGGVLGHDDQRGDAEPARMERDRLGVIAGGHGDDAAPPLLLGERHQLDQRAAILERAGNLEIFVFDEDLGARELRQLGRWQGRRAHHLAADELGGLEDIANVIARLSSSPACGMIVINSSLRRRRAAQQM